jgi:hypothetical protein
MKLGDFFKSAPYARPVNPRPAPFTAVARGTILPGGYSNPTGQPIAATVTGAFVFITGDVVEEARVAARSYLQEKFKNATLTDYP